MGRSRDLADLISGAGTLPDGAIPSGSVVQVVQAEDATNSTATVGSTGDWVIDGISLSITPKFLNSTMHIFGSFFMTSDSASTTANARLVRVIGATATTVSPLSTGSQSSVQDGGAFVHVYSSPAIANNMGLNQSSFFFKDQSLSISAHTYKIQIGGNGATHDVHYNQYGVAVPSYEDTWTPTSCMTCMEIKG